jgi:hypothetical protein
MSQLSLSEIGRAVTRSAEKAVYLTQMVAAALRAAQDAKVDNATVRRCVLRLEEPLREFMAVFLPEEISDE